jgi:dihydrofolate reductase
MAELSITAFLSLDGVVQAPGGPEEDPSGGFDLGGWSVPYGDEDFGAFVTQVFDRVGAFLLGRRTYDIFAGYWPAQTGPDPIADRLNNLPKYVVSDSLEKADWSGTTVLRGEGLAGEIRALKERTDGELQVHGSATLAGFLLANDLADTLNLMTFPVVLGKGRRFFAEGAVPTAFRHEGSRVTGAGVAIHTYRLAGRPEFGSY